MASRDGQYSASVSGPSGTVHVALGITVLAALAVLIILHRVFGSIRA
jgi:hypothetical protein